MGKFTSMPKWRSTILLCALLFGCGKSGSNPTPSNTPPPTPTTEASSDHLTKLVKEDVKIGDGPVVAKEHDTVFCWYTGTLADGSMFDSTEKPKEPLNFVLTTGEGGVIPGWVEGIQGMRAGGERKLSIPYKLAYGEQGRDKIPPRADLYFDIKLAYIVEPGKDKTFDQKDVKIGAGATAEKGKIVKVLYKGWLLNGNLVMDVSDPKKPDSFTIGKGGEVIQGLEYGVLGMKVGGKRNLMLPPAAAFGPVGNGPMIPGNSPLRLEVTLVDVK